MKKLTVSLLILLAGLLAPRIALATHETVVCPQPYGNGVVCAAKVHEPVDAALGDINPMVVISLLFFGSGVAFYFSKKA